VAADGLGERRVLAEVAGDERECRAGRRRLEVGDDCLHVGRLPDLDALEDHEPAAGPEEPHRVAGGHRVLAAHRRRVVQLDGVDVEPAAQACDGTVNLRTVAAPDQIRRLKLVRHRRQA